MTEHATAGPPTGWFRRYPTPEPPRMRLVVLPHAGGNAAFYHDWGHALGRDVEVLVTRYPGRQERIAEPCVDAMESLADAVTAALLPLADVPLALFGHSMGASVAHEVTLRLEHRHGVRPAGLFVSARPAPHRLRPSTAYRDGDEALLAEVRKLGGTEGDLLADPELRELVMPAIRADFTLVGTYRPRSAVPVGCPVAAYAGDGDPAVAVGDVRAWSEVAPAGFSLTVLPGGHFYLTERRAELVADLASRLDGRVTDPRPPR